MKLLRLFWEFFKISLLVVGGGYAIIVVADEVFGRKRRMLAEGEVLEHLPIFQMVPGLIAGNTAIYVGLKIAGRTGAAVALLGAALPSFLIFLAVSCGYSFLPVENSYVAGALMGLRAALTGVVVGTIVKGWRSSVKGAYGYATVAAACLLVSALRWNVALVMLLAMCAGVVWKFCGGATPAVMAGGAGVAVEPLSRRARVWAALGGAAALALVTFFLGTVFWTFVKFGCLGFGGGFVLVPLYLQTFVGEAAQLLQIPAEEFSNLMALTQATPGPVSVNAATFFGYRMAGVAGAAVATTALLLPSYFLLTAALAGIERWKTSRFVQGLLWGVRPAPNALMIHAAIVFAGMSVWHGGFQPFACALAVFAAAALLTRRLSVMVTIFLCAALGAAFAAL